MLADRARAAVSVSPSSTTTTGYDTQLIRGMGSQACNRSREDRSVLTAWRESQGVGGTKSQAAASPVAAGRPPSWRYLARTAETPEGADSVAVVRGCKRQPVETLYREAIGGADGERGRDGHGGESRCSQLEIETPVTVR
jgi:hypothetical protein